MKIIFKILVLTIVFSFTFQSCSSNDDENNSLDQRFAKKWYTGTQYFDIEQGVSCENNYYNLKGNGDIEYKYWAGGNTCQHYTENGNWSIENNILYRNFPSDEGTNNGLILSDEIISISETELVVKDLEDDDITTYYNYE
ncbi:hypothetical protein KO504_02065 [Winogradskyella psychrotolerans]|uniref:hypothetical protein n=1 Tax=Winogradskyella psychrotolerans TaxID=1344585 RepID=UPI001C06C402|nr:hypothetical protein [Winogradskyella psychrotolerans]MBU2920117.1 hypothetical protein [Winogradskyella psychrotolerans]